MKDGKIIALSTGGFKQIGKDPSLSSDTLNDDSDKTFIVPAGKIWEIKNVYVSLTTTATVGNRLLALRVMKADDTIVMDIRAGLVQAASLAYRYIFGVGVPHTTTVAQLGAYIPIPTLILPAGYKIRILDVTAVAVAADDMLTHIIVDEFDSSI